MTGRRWPVAYGSTLIKSSHATTRFEVLSDRTEQWFAQIFLTAKLANRPALRLSRFNVKPRCQQ